MKQKTIVVDRGNANSCWRSMNELREIRPDLEKMLRRCPVGISGHGFFRVVSSIIEVDGLIDTLNRGLELYRRQKPKHRRPLDMTCFKISKLAVTPQNIASVRDYIAALQKNGDFIKRNLRRYPLEAAAHGIYFLFSDAREVDWVIGSLKRKVREAEHEEQEAKKFASLPWWKRMLAVGTAG